MGSRRRGATRLEVAPRCGFSGDVTGSGANGSHLRGGATSGRKLTYRIGGLGTLATFSGDIAEQVTGTTTNLAKTGPGIWNLGGPATHRGTTTVEAGTLCVLAGGAITNSASLDVQSGATLCVNGGSISVETVTIASGTFSNSGILDLLTSASNLPANFVNTGIVIENSERRILAAEKSGANFSVTVQGYAGHTYQLRRTDTLGAWTNIGPAVAATGAMLTLTETGGATGIARFYRVLVSP